MERSVRVGNGTLSYVEGDGNGTALVSLHGLSVEWSRWADVIELLPERLTSSPRIYVAVGGRTGPGLAMRSPTMSMTSPSSSVT